MPATVVAIQLCRSHDAPLESVASARALLDTGLEGDLHARPGSRRQVLFVDHEVLDDLGLAPGVIREQVTVRGMNVQNLAPGTTLRIGSVRFEAGKPCEPCELMDQIRPGLRLLLEDRRGRFLRIVEAGTFAAGDPIVIE